MMRWPDAFAKATLAVMLAGLTACADLHASFPPLPDHKPPASGRYGASQLPRNWRARYRKLARPERARFDALEAERTLVEIWMRRATAEERRDEEDRIDEIRRQERLLLGEPG